VALFAQVPPTLVPRKVHRPFDHYKNGAKALFLMAIKTDLDQIPTRYGVNFDNVGFGQKVTSHPSSAAPSAISATEKS
jgi:hypothetical protein